MWFSPIFSITGDPEASFTKDEMQQGKHQEFEKRLHDQLIQSMQQQQQHHQQQQQNIQISGLSGYVLHR